MKLSEFDYILPKEKIAQTPAEPRDSSKLLILKKNSGNIKDAIFSDLENYLGKNDVLIVNKTRVIKARLKGKLGEKEIEIFLHKEISENTWDCLVYPGKKLKPGKTVNFYLPSLARRGIEGEVKNGEKENSSPLLTATIKSISDNGRIVHFETYGKDFFEIIDTIGETPLPPYIKNTSSDDERYQTVYNDEKGGSVAAPTAGLHFTPQLLERLKNKGVKIEKVLLHVGLGTFMNVETENIEDHFMHTEFISLDKETAKRLNEYKKMVKELYP